jgi:type VI secretion system protein ImpL
MKEQFKKLISNWWVVSIAVLVLLILALVVLLPTFVAPMRPLLMRLVIFLGLVVVWGGLAAWRMFDQTRASQRLADRLAGEDIVQSEGAEQAGRMKAALSKFKQTMGGKSDYLYSRPWFVIIGPPGAGKTTALVNSGLRFPFSDNSLTGFGGTRNLDFWFADEAVLVDTAGRYTSQDSHQERDRDGWVGFLNALRVNRPLQPINGVLIAIGFDEIVRSDCAAIDNHAATIRRRVNELHSALQVSVPVYIIFTKADLLAGFSEYFDDLDVEGRRAVLGSTLQWEPTNKPTSDDFAIAFDRVSQAVDDRVSKRLQEELDARRRALILGFPRQLDEIRARVIRLVSGIFPSEGAETAAKLRGFYMASGVQQGTPFDRLLGGITQVTATVAETSASAGRAYFLNRLIKDVVIPEAGLVEQTSGSKRRRLALMGAGVGAIGLVSIATLVLWTISFIQNRGLQNKIQTQTAAVVSGLERDKIDRVEVSSSDPDLEAVLPSLNALRNLPHGTAFQKAGKVPFTMGMGLYQRGLTRKTDLAYREALQRVMLPRILLRLEQAMRDGQSDPISSYEALKVYLMLGGQAPRVERPTIRNWVLNDWEKVSLPGADRETIRAELGVHLDVLTSDPGLGRVWLNGRAPLDADLIAATRAQLQTLSVGERAYSILKEASAASGQPDWTPASYITQGHSRAFRDGPALLGYSIPFFYTKDGFEKAYQLGLATVQVNLQKDAWVLGADQNISSVREQMQSIRQSVATLYAQDYIKAWEGLLGLTAPANYFGNDAAFGAATGTPPPLKVLLLELRRNTTFPAKSAVQSLEKAAAERAQRALPSAVQSVVRDRTNAPAIGVDAGKEIEAHFKEVHDYVGTGAAPAQIDAFFDKLKAAVAAKGQADRAGGGIAAPAAQAELNRAMSEMAVAAAVTPGALKNFAARTTQQGDKAQVASARSAVADAYPATLVASCRAATERKYPFVYGAGPDASIGDMLRVFGLNAEIDQYVQSQLTPLLDTSGDSWSWRRDNPVTRNLSSTTPMQFSKARNIRDLILGGVTAQIEAVSFGPEATAVEFSASGQTYRFVPDMPGARPIQWNTGSLPEARVTVFKDEAVTKEVKYSGPWALFRLMDELPSSNAGPSAVDVLVGKGAGAVKLRITYGGSYNPFSRGRTWSFSCPKRL